MVLATAVEVNTSLHRLVIMFRFARAPGKWVIMITQPAFEGCATVMARRASNYSMPSRFIPALFTLILAASPLGAQFGGIRMPGSGGRYPGGNNGGQPGASAPSKVYGPTETLTGSLREISSANLVIDAGDDRIVLVQVQSGTKYLSTMGKVKASDFEPGDHVTVEATRDDSDHYYSKTLTMNKKGTPEDKAAALQAANSSHSGGTSGGDNPTDSDPDRPRMHRASSDTDAASPAPSPRASSAGSGGTTSSAPDSVGSSTTSSAAGRRPAVSQPASTPSVSDGDSGPPALRRSSPASSQPPVQVASTERPSLSADDVNGVTRLPVITSPPPNPDRPIPTPDTRDRRGVSSSDSGGDPVIDDAREAAFSFSETLPNYVVKQITNRYQTGASRGGRTSWQPLDIVTTDLIYEDGKERYTNIMVNGKPTKYIEQTGSWSEGEFASMLQAILAPGTNADFRNQRSTTFANRAAYRYDYTVEQPRSTWTLHADGQTYSPSYTGAIWVDKATSRVLRIEIAARNLPRNFPLDTAESSIDYDFVLISDQKVLLPAHAESLSCIRGTSDCTRNTTDFRDYKKYGAETNITFEGAANM